MTAAHTFTFSLRLDEDAWDGQEMECASEASAIAAGREALQARIDLRPIQAGRARHGTVGVGIGSMIAGPDRVVWLGEWEWSSEEGWAWTPSD
jgi:hypothetical protein